MPRSPRSEYVGAIHHISNRGNDAGDLFFCDRDRRLFLKRVAEACIEFGQRCLGYCLMTTHYHLLLRTDVAPGMSAAMQMIDARYAEHFNLAYAHTGHVFEKRFDARHVDCDAYLFEVIRYIELNPVRATLCQLASLWQWNSYGAIVGTRSHQNWFDRDAVLALFDRDPNHAVQRYVDFIARGDPHAPLADTPVKRRRRERDAAIRKRYSEGNITIEEVARMFRTSTRTAARALRKHDTEGSTGRHTPLMACQQGSDPSVACHITTASKVSSTGWPR